MYIHWYKKIILKIYVGYFYLDEMDISRRYNSKLLDAMISIHAE